MSSSLNSLTLKTLRNGAQLSERRRKNLNLHNSYADPCQRFLNAICRDSYIRPHRHLLDPKEELLVAISGMLALCVFDNEGALEQITPFGSEMYWSSSVSFAVTVSPSTWHTVVALTDDAVLLETKDGPYDPALAKEPAPWAPEEGDGSAEFLSLLRDAALACAA